MAEQKRTAETHDEKLRPREPKQEAAAREAARQGTFAAPGGGPIGPPDDISIRAVAARLGDTRFQTAQRQAMAERIRRASGNQFLYRAVTQARQAEGVGDHVGSQRTPRVDGQLAGDTAGINVGLTEARQGQEEGTAQAPGRTVVGGSAGLLPGPQADSERGASLERHPGDMWAAARPRLRSTPDTIQRVWARGELERVTRRGRGTLGGREPPPTVGQLRRSLTALTRRTRLLGPGRPNPEDARDMAAFFRGYEMETFVNDLAECLEAMARHPTRLGRRPPDDRRATARALFGEYIEAIGRVHPSIIAPGEARARRIYDLEAREAAERRRLGEEAREARRQLEQRVRGQWIDYWRRVYTQASFTVPLGARGGAWRVEGRRSAPEARLMRWIFGSGCGWTNFQSQHRLGAAARRLGWGARRTDPLYLQSLRVTDASHRGYNDARRAGERYLRGIHGNYIQSVTNLADDAMAIQAGLAGGRDVETERGRLRVALRDWRVIQNALGPGNRARLAGILYCWDHYWRRPQLVPPLRQGGRLRAAGIPYSAGSGAYSFDPPLRDWRD